MIKRLHTSLSAILMLLCMALATFAASAATRQLVAKNSYAYGIVITQSGTTVYVDYSLAGATSRTEVVLKINGVQVGSTVVKTSGFSAAEQGNRATFTGITGDGLMTADITTTSASPVATNGATRLVKHANDDNAANTHNLSDGYIPFYQPWSIAINNSPIRGHSAQPW